MLGIKDLSQPRFILFHVEPFTSPLPDNWTTLIYDLERRITEIAEMHDGFLVLNCDRSDDPFVQLVVQGGGYLIAEASATIRDEDGPDDRKLIDDAIAQRLLGLGWCAPLADPMKLATPQERPNFFKESPTHQLNAAMFAELLVRTLCEAFVVDDPSLVRVRGGVLPPNSLPPRA